MDVHQINCTFYDALGRRDDEYLVARAIQCFVPGIPQIYYVGLLAGGNDMELLRRTGVGRDINRHYYTRRNCSRRWSGRSSRRCWRFCDFATPTRRSAARFTSLPSRRRTCSCWWTNGADFARLDVRPGADVRVVTCSGGSRSSAGSWHALEALA